MEEQGNDRGLGTVQAWVLGLLAGVVVVALMALAYTIGKNNADEPAAAPPELAEPAGGGAEPAPEPAAGGPGEELFAANCGSCHTLEAAGTSGTAGPNLDDLAPDSAQVLTAIENGGTGSGAMPAGIVAGAEAQEVADYVAEAHGG